MYLLFIIKYELSKSFRTKWEHEKAKHRSKTQIGMMNCFSLNESECLAITKCNTTLKELVSAKPIEALGGEILKITRLASFGDCLVKIYSCDKKDLCLSNATYSCDYSVLKMLNETFASMLMSIPDRAKRLMICSSNETENFLMKLKLNDVVKVNKAVLNCDEDAVCIVKYIGAVPQIGPGTYIGFVLFHESDIINDKNNLARQYFNCNNQNGFIRNCGCFFSRKFLLDQDTNNLLMLVKKSQPNTTVSSANQKQSKKAPPPNTSAATTKSVKHTHLDGHYKTGPFLPTNSQPSAPPNPVYVPSPIVYQPPTTDFYPSPPAYSENINKIPNYPRQQYLNDTIPRNTSSLANYPRQKYITDAIPRNIISPSSIINHNTIEIPRCDLNSTNYFVERHRSLTPASETVRIRHSIREGPKKSAKRIIFEEKVTHKYSGGKKKQCVIL